MIAAKHPIYAKYKGETTKRKLCPYVLGYKKERGPENEASERVLCYQLNGPTPTQGWRCFDLSSLVIVTPPPPPSDWVVRSDHSKWQNSVQNAKHQIPF